MAERITTFSVDTPADHDAEAFAEKMRYWRERGVPIKYSYGGRAEFHGPTIRERQERQVQEGREMGHNLEPKGTVRWV